MNFKDLTPKKKLEHIWEYYKWLILGLLFVAVAGSSLAYSIFIKPKPVTYAGLAVYGTHVSPENCEAITGELNSRLGLTPPDTVTVTNYFFNPDDKLFNVEMEQKFVTYLYSLELNLIAGDEGYTNLFIDSEYTAPLTDYYTAEQLEALGDKLYYRKDPLDGKEKPFAINLAGSSLFKAYGVFEGSQKPCYLTLVPVAGKEEAALRLAELLIN